MQAQVRRHINSGYQYDSLFPKSVLRDSVVVAAGKAQLKDTLNLMQQMIQETLDDTSLLAFKLKGRSIVETCRNIWNFVYTHIQYKMDKRGVEQVRRPSRTWADRESGVDCDCYTVFIGSILSNLNIPYKIRITKYGGKQHFQHVYPVVFIKGKQITMDCVTDQFDTEVPYSEKKDFGMNSPIVIQDISGLCGVDTIDISLDALEQFRIPLRQIIKPRVITANCNLDHEIIKQHIATKTKNGQVLSPYRLKAEESVRANNDGHFDLLDFFVKATISVGLGIGVIRLFTTGKKLKRNKTV